MAEAPLDELSAGPILVAFQGLPLGGAPQSDSHRLVGDVIRGRSDEIRECYESAMDVWGTFESRVALRLVIGPLGEVADVVIVRDESPSVPLACCVVSRVRAWRFPPHPRGGVWVVNYPWIFKVAR